MVTTQDDNRSNIVIIGFMATGKTTLAAELSENLGMEYLDIDKIIEENTDMKIWEIFEKYGEGHFRQLEKKTIENLNKSQNIIISCGGGACLDAENVNNIKKMGKVVLLEANPATILSRIENDTSRPLLKDRAKVAEIKKIMDERRDSYDKLADIIIDTNGKSVSNIIDEILSELSL